MKKIEISTKTPPLSEDELHLFGNKNSRDRYHYLVNYGPKAYRQRYPGKEHDPAKEAEEERLFRSKLRSELEADRTTSQSVGVGTIPVAQSGEVVPIVREEPVAADQSNLQETA